MENEKEKMRGQEASVNKKVIQGGENRWTSISSLFWQFCYLQLEGSYLPRCYYIPSGDLRKRRSPGSAMSSAAGILHHMGLVTTNVWLNPTGILVRS